MIDYRSNAASFNQDRIGNTFLMLESAQSNPRRPRSLRLAAGGFIEGLRGRDGHDCQMDGSATKSSNKTNRSGNRLTFFFRPSSLTHGCDPLPLCLAIEAGP